MSHEIQSMIQKPSNSKRLFQTPITEASATQAKIDSISWRPQGDHKASSPTPIIGLQREKHTRRSLVDSGAAHVNDMQSKPLSLTRRLLHTQLSAWKNDHASGGSEDFVYFAFLGALIALSEFDC